MYLRTIKVGRDAVNGRFVSLRTVRKRPKTTVIETYSVVAYDKRPTAVRRRRRPHRSF